MKLLELRLDTKENTSVYQTAKKYAEEATSVKIVPVAEIVEKDFIAELTVEYEANGEKLKFDVMSYDVASLMSWMKENHPELHEQVPGFRIDKFQALADRAVSSSCLRYQALSNTECPIEYEFGFDPGADDFIPELNTVKESVDLIVKQGFYTELRVYPDTPNGFWNFYGLDFDSLLDHVVKD